MNLTKTLLGYLNRVFNKDPGGFLGLSMSYAGTDMAWAIADGVLTVTVTGGVGAGFTVTLANYTIMTLASYIASLRGFTVNAIAPSDLAHLSAKVLLDGAGSQNTGTTKLLGYTSILYGYMENMAQELEDAEVQLNEALKQVQINNPAGAASAAGLWLDEIGGYYGIPRLAGEPDAAYGPRIIAEVLRAKGNNVALESAIKYYTGQQTAVVDVALPTFTDPLHNAAHTHNGVIHYNSTGSFQYNLFDVSVGYDLINGADITAFLAAVEGVVNRLRDAGNHMRSLLLTGSQIGDDFTAPTDAFAVLAAAMLLTDALSAPSEALVLGIGMVALADPFTAPGDTTDSLDVAYTTTYDGLRFYDGAIQYLGGHTTHGSLGGTVTSIS